MKVHNQAMSKGSGNTAGLVAQTSVVNNHLVDAHHQTIRHHRCTNANNTTDSSNSNYAGNKPLTTSSSYGSHHHNEINEDEPSNSQVLCNEGGIDHQDSTRAGCCQFIRSPVRPSWTTASQKKRVASPLAPQSCSGTKNGIRQWQHRFGRMAAEVGVVQHHRVHADDDDDDEMDEDGDQKYGQEKDLVQKALNGADRHHSNQQDQRTNKASTHHNHHRLVSDKLGSGQTRQAIIAARQGGMPQSTRQRTTLRQSSGRQAGGVGQETRTRIYRKMSQSDGENEFEVDHHHRNHRRHHNQTSNDAREADEEQEEEEEVRSAMAGFNSSCNSSNAEHHNEEEVGDNSSCNASSENGDCSQSEISLCDDGGSEMEEGEGHQILGHLDDASAGHRMDDGDSQSGEAFCKQPSNQSSESYDDEDDSIQHAKNHYNSNMSGRIHHQSRGRQQDCSIVDGDAAQAWDFNDFIELIEQDTQQSQKAVPESHQLSHKIRFYPTNGRHTNLIKAEKLECDDIINQAQNNDSDDQLKAHKNLKSDDTNYIINHSNSRQTDFILNTKKATEIKQKITEDAFDTSNKKKEILIHVSKLDDDLSMQEPTSNDQAISSMNSSKNPQQQNSPVLSSGSCSSTSLLPKQFVSQLSNRRQSQLLGKRTFNQQKKDQTYWLPNTIINSGSPKLLPKKQINSEDNAAIMNASTSHPDDSLLDRILHKRQRVNSDLAFKKQEFSFMPTALGATSVGGPAAKSLQRSRDLKASDKSKSGAAINKILGGANSLSNKAPDQHGCQQDQEEPMRPIEIKVPDLLQSHQNPRFNNTLPPKKPELLSKIPEQPADSQDQQRKKPTAVMFNRGNNNLDSSYSSNIYCDRSQSSSSPQSLKPAREHASQLSFPQQVESKPAGLRDRVFQMAQIFGGECLSDKRLSICKGAEAYKFKCINGHIFYRFVTELENNLKPLQQLRKLSKSTMASSSSSASDDDISSPQQQLLNANCCWCPKCDSFYRSAAIIAKNCGFKLCGEIYSKNLSLRCEKAQHVTVLSYQKRLQGNLKCTACRKDERDAVKAKLREEERLQDQYYTEMQEKMFAEARKDMEREMAQAGFSGYEQPFFMTEAQRRHHMEQSINQTAENLAQQFMQEMQNSDMPSNSSVSKDQAFLVYKFLNTPEEMLVAGMTQMQPAQLTQFYRKLAKQLHPDKNHHPQAKEAFQTVYAAMGVAQANLKKNGHKF